MEDLWSEIWAGEGRLCRKLSSIANVASEAALVSAQTLDLDYSKGASVPRLLYQPLHRPRLLYLPSTPPSIYPHSPNVYAPVLSSERSTVQRRPELCC